MFSCTEYIEIEEEEESPCETFEHLDNEVIGCLYTYTLWGDLSTFTFINCTTSREAFEWASCQEEPWHWTLYNERGNHFGLTCNCE